MFDSRQSPPATLLAVIFLALSGCGEEPKKAERLVRLTDEARISSIESERWDIIRGLAPEREESLAFQVLDLEGGWYPFRVGVELGDQKPEKGEDLGKARFSEDDQALLVPPRTGLARVIPIPRNKQILLECTGSFGSQKDLQAEVIRLSAARPLPQYNQGGVLKEYIRRLGGDRVLVPAQMKSDKARGVIITAPGTEALLLLIHAANKWGHLDQVRLAVLGGEAGRESRDFEREPEFLKALLEKRSVENVLRPTLTLPLGTRIQFKETTIPRKARFHCAMHLPSGADPGIRVTLTGEDEGGQKHTILSWRPSPKSIEGWEEIHEDLSSLAGLTLRLVFSCEGDGPGAREVISMADCGAPRIAADREEGDEQRPNVILVSLDTLRWDHLGCYGCPRPVSPHIDALAARSLVFRHAYSHAPFTLPSHASLFTSLLPSVHGAVNNQGAIVPRKLPIMAEILARAGWNTASFNGSGFVSHEFGFDRGFDLYCEVDPLGDRFLDHVVAKEKCLADGSQGSLQRTFAWIDDMGDAPFFLFLHTYMVHDYLPPKEWVDAFRTEKSGDLEPGKKTRQMIRKRYVRKEGVPPESLAYLKEMYDGTVRAADDMVGELLTLLEVRGLLENTMLIVTSDHGEEFMEHGNLYHALTLYEEMIHVPLIVSAPGLEGGRQIDAFVRQVDLLPTVLEMLKVDFKGHFQGRSIVPLMRGEALSPELIYAEVDQPDMARRWALIRDSLKYIEGDVDPKLFAPAPAAREFFRIDEDPGERNDLCAEEKDQVKGMERLMGQVKENLSELRSQLDLEGGETSTLSKEMKDFLEQQGYL